MASKYEAITLDNIRRRGEEFDDIGNLLAEKLYGDRSHFIYELLQNAEDALALRRQTDPDGDFSGTVTFRLFRNRLEVSHYGKLFDQDDVCAISDVLRGTKNERQDQIGTFGIGFKSVYAFTRSPEVHSGDENFVIEHFIRPRKVQARPVADPSQTLFYFPFNHHDVPDTAAFDLIQKRLKSFGPRSLLFLRHVSELNWTVDGVEESGSYRREARLCDTAASYVRILGRGPNVAESEEEWLVVERCVRHPKRDEDLSIKLAYSIHTEADVKSVQALSRSPLTAFFPTAMETGLAFLIHGPFASTPARDNIQSDSPWNNLLLADIAKLTADSICVCQRQGLLTAQFLACLPIEEDRFPVGSPFRPIYDAVVETFRTKPVVPAASGEHALASELVLGRAQELRELLAGGVLHDVLGTTSTVKDWVDPAVSETRMAKAWHYLRETCAVRVFDSESFARLITAEFLDRRDEDWMIRFYVFLSGQEALWRTYKYTHIEGVLRSKPFIRCEDGQHRQPFDSSQRPQVFLPTDADAEQPSVKRSLYEKPGAKEFFERLGLVPPDLCTEVLHSILPCYGQGKVSLETHAGHMRSIKSALQLASSPRYGEMVETLQTKPWILARKFDGAETRYFCPPSLVYIDTPELQTYFEGNPNVYVLAEDEPNINWARLGVRATVEVKCRGLPAYHRHPDATIELRSEWGYHQKGLRCFDPDTEVVGLAHAMATITLSKALYIWNEMLPPLVPFIHGQYVEATRQNYDNAHTYAKDSKLGELLKRLAWIPVRDGTFRRATECTVADLHAELKRNDGLINALGVKPDPVEIARQFAASQQSLVALAGFRPEVATLLVQNKDRLTADVIQRLLDAEHSMSASQPAFPERKVHDPERRIAKVRDRAHTADPKTFEMRERSVRASAPPVDPKVWLREQYTNNQGIMVCQQCKNAMPFKLPDGVEYYFEAVQVSNDLTREDHTTYLALCPLCAAKYNVLVKRDVGRINPFIQSILGAEELTVPVATAHGPMVISFVETHLSDLKAVLPESLPHGPNS